MKILLRNETFFNNSIRFYIRLIGIIFTIIYLCTNLINKIKEAIQNFWDFESTDFEKIEYLAQSKKSYDIDNCFCNELKTVQKKIDEGVLYYNFLKKYNYDDDDVDYLFNTIVRAREGNLMSINSILGAITKAKKDELRSLNFIFSFYKKLLEKYKMKNFIEKYIGEIEDLDYKATDIILLFSLGKLLGKRTITRDFEYCSTLKIDIFGFMNFFEYLGHNKKLLEEKFLRTTNKIDYRNIKFYIFDNSSRVFNDNSNGEQLNFVRRILLVTNNENIPIKFRILKSRTNIEEVINEINEIEKIFKHLKSIDIFCDEKLLCKKIKQRLGSNKKLFAKMINEACRIEKEAMFVIKEHFDRSNFGRIVVWNPKRIEGYCIISFISLYLSSHLFKCIREDKKQCLNFSDIIESIKNIKFVQYSFNGINFYINVYNPSSAKKYLKQLGLVPSKMTTKKEDLFKNDSNKKNNVNEEEIFVQFKKSYMYGYCFHKG